MLIVLTIIGLVTPGRMAPAMVARHRLQVIILTRIPIWYGNGNVSNTSVINSSWVRADSQVQAMRAQTAGVASATELQKSANNLESLLGEKPMAGSPHLRALGTNLFVRNYADHDDDSIPPVDPIIELKARQQSLADLERGDRAKAQRLFP